MGQGTFSATQADGEHSLAFPRPCLLPPGHATRYITLAVLGSPATEFRPKECERKGCHTVTSGAARETLPGLLLRARPFLGLGAEGHLGGRALKDGGTTRWQDPESPGHRQKKYPPFRNIGFEQK